MTEQNQDGSQDGQGLHDIPLFANYQQVPPVSFTAPAAAEADPGWLPAPAAGPAENTVDWEVVRTIKTQTVAALQPALRRFREDEGREPTLADRRELAKKLIRDAVTQQVRRDVRDGVRDWAAAEESVYAKAVLDSQFGFGRLQPLFEIETAENITVHGHDSVVVRHTDGRLEHRPSVADSDEELTQQLQFMGENASPRRAFNPASPEMTLMVGNQFRIHAISDEFSTRPSIAIRRHHLTHVSLADLSDTGLMPFEVAQFLDRAVKAGKSIVVAGAQGAGKALALDTPVPTPKGWTTMGALQAGDEVFDDQGQPCRVVTAHPVQHNRPCYKVSFDDGTAIVADADHLWQVSRRTDRTNKGRGRGRTPTYYYSLEERARLSELADAAGRVPDVEATVASLVELVGERYRSALYQEAAKLAPSGYIQIRWGADQRRRDVQAYSKQLLLKALAARYNAPKNPVRQGDGLQTMILTTKEMADKPLWAHAGRTWRTRNFAVELAKPLQYPLAEQFIDPYVLGVWLGDGATACARIATADPEILTELEAAGYPCTKIAGNNYDYGVGGALQAKLRAAHLLGDKHIPRVYLQGDVGQRTALLQGLMDTDGTATVTGGCEYTSTLEVLAEQALELVCSLGYKPTLTSRSVEWQGQACGRAFTVRWTTRDPMFRLPRKLERQSLNAGGPKRRHITAITPVESVPVRCITVDSPQSLFLVSKSCIVTHNTTLLRALIDAIPRTERIATLETDLELFSHLEPGRENDLALVSRTGMGETSEDGKKIGDITVSDMIPPSLRQAVSRVIVGEVRGNEGAAMMEAMQIGVGTLSTTHSKSAHSIADRLAARAAQTGRLSIEEAYIQIGLNIDLFVYVHLVDDTWRGGSRFRVISEILHVKPGDSVRPSSTTIYRTDPNTFAPAEFTPEGELVAELARYDHPMDRYHRTDAA